MEVQTCPKRAAAIVPLADPFSGIFYENNTISVEGEHLGVQFFSGKGAGGTPTGYALFADVAEARRKNHYAYAKIRLGNPLKLDNNHRLRVLLGGRPNIPGAQLLSTFEAGKGQWTLAEIRTEALLEWKKTPASEGIPVVQYA